MQSATFIGMGFADLDDTTLSGSALGMPSINDITNHGSMDVCNDTDLEVKETTQMGDARDATTLTIFA